MNYTQHYQLPQWVETDRILMEDFNNMASAIDTALGGHDTDLEALQAQDTALESAIAECGNCRLYTTTYVGSASSSVTLTFPGKPLFLMVQDQSFGVNYIVVTRGTAMVVSYPGGNSQLTLTWGENQVTWVSEMGPLGGLNETSIIYRVIALMDSVA